MFRLSHVVAIAFFASFPFATFADCSSFEAYNSAGNYHEDIQNRIEEALTCPRWEPNFDQSSLNHAQGHIVQSLLSDNKDADAVAMAQLYFADADQRYQIAALSTDHQDILTANGTLYTRLSSHFQQMGMLAVDAESTFTGCNDIETLNALTGFVRDNVQTDLDDFIERTERTRLRVEQQLEDNSLEDWQEFFPDATSLNEVRNNARIIDALNPDAQARRYFETERRFFSLFTTTVRVDGGMAERCLMDKFLDYPDVVGMTPEQRKETFPGLSGFLESKFGLD